MQTIKVDDRTPEQRETHRWGVVARDKFMSGWGQAFNGASRCAWACGPNVSTDRISMKPYFNGPKLILPDWHFGGTDARVPHRSHTLAFHRNGLTQYFVNANHKESLFWVQALAPGFAGDCSRASHTCATRSKDLAALWIEAVKAGNVGIG